MTPRRLQFLVAHYATGEWWAASYNRQLDPTGTAHALFDGEALCGARPLFLGGSFNSAAAAGALECRRCRKIIDEVKNAAR